MNRGEILNFCKQTAVDMRISHITDPFFKKILSLLLSDIYKLSSTRI
jgi:hypothetical protein